MEGEGGREGGRVGGKEEDHVATRGQFIKNECIFHFLGFHADSNKKY